jgi:hypothetical protein
MQPAKSRNGSGAAVAVFARNSQSNGSSPTRGEFLINNFQQNSINSARRDGTNDDLQMYKAASSVAEELN